MTKSYVTMEQHVCVVCGQAYDTGSILMDKGMRERFDMHTITGNGVCEEHQKLADDGYIALIEAINDTGRETVSAEDANRTGRLLHMRSDAFEEVFDTRLDKGRFPMTFITPDVFDLIVEMQPVEH